MPRGESYTEKFCPVGPFHLVKGQTYILAWLRKKDYAQEGVVTREKDELGQVHKTRFRGPGLRALPAMTPLPVINSDTAPEKPGLYVEEALTSFETLII